MKKKMQSASVAGVCTTPTGTSNPKTPALESQLAKAEALLEQCGYVRLPDGSYTQTPEARQKAIDALDLDSYEFRDAVRADNGDDATWPFYASGRLRLEVEMALVNLCDKFGLYGGLDDDPEIVDPIEEALVGLIEDEAKNDAKQRAEDEAELTEETPAPSLVCGSGSVTPSVGGAE